MKWINHKVLTGSVIFFLTGNPLSTLISITGSILPDLMEGFNFSSARWKKFHRTWSHWIPAYLTVLLLSLLSSPSPLLLNQKLTTLRLNSPLLTYLHELSSSLHQLANTPPAALISYFLFFLSAGAILHVIEDALTGPVPFIHPYKKNLSLKLFNTGGAAEYLFTILSSLFLLYLRFTLNR